MRASRWARSAFLMGISLLAMGTSLTIGVVRLQRATSPPWEPDANAAAPYGNLVLYDANGNVGHQRYRPSSPFAFAVGSTPADAGATKASLAFYNPQPGSPPCRATGPGPERPARRNSARRPACLLARPPTSWPSAATIPGRGNLRLPTSPPGWRPTSARSTPATPTPSRSA